MATEQEIARLIIRVRMETAEVKKEVAGLRGEISSFAGYAKKALAGIGVTLGLGALISQAKNLVAFGIDYNSEIEQSKIGLAALISATANIRDNTGRLLEGQEKWNASILEAGKLYEKIQRLAFETTARTPEIVQGFQAMIGSGASVGLKFEEILDLSILIVQAMSVMRLPMIQMRVEANALLKGEENIRADLMKNLNITGEQVKEAQRLNKQYDFLKEKLAPFAIAGKAQLGTWQGLKTTLKDVGSILVAIGFREVFQDATLALKGMLDYLIKGGSETVQFSKNAKSLADNIDASFKSARGHFSAFQEEYKIILESTVLVLKTVQLFLFSFLAGLTTIGVAAVGFFRGTLEILDSLTLWAIPGLGKAIDDLRAREDRMLGSLEEQAKSIWTILGQTEEKAKDISKTGFNIDTKTAPDPEQIKKSREAAHDLMQKYAELGEQITKLVSPTKAAEMELERFIAEKMRDVKATAETSRAIALLRQRYQELKFATIQKETMEKVEEGMKGIASETEKAMLELIRIKDPMAADQIELEELIDRLREGVPATQEITQAIELLRSSWLRLKDAQRDVAATEAAIERRMAESSEKAANSMLTLSEAFRKRQIGVREYYAEIRGVAVDAAQEELDVIDQRIALAGTEAEKDKARTDRLKREGALRRQLIEITRDEEDGVKSLAAEQRALAEAEISRGIAAVKALEGRREISADAAMGDQIALNERLLGLYKSQLSEINKATDPASWVALQGQISGIENTIVDLQIALRNLPAQQAKAGADLRGQLAELTGDWQGIRAAQEASLLADRAITLQTQNLTQAQREMLDVITEIRIARERARAEMDKAALIEQGATDYSVKLNDRLADQFENVIPGAVDATGDAFGGLLQGFIDGKADFDLFKDGVLKGLSDIAKQILVAYAKMLLLRTVMGIGGLFSGGGAGSEAVGMSPTGYAGGGGIPGTGPKIITAHGGEFMEPEHSVRYYGEGIYELMRRRAIPREFFSSFASGMRAPRGSNLQAGGVAVPGSSYSISVGPINAQGIGERTAEALRRVVDRAVVDFMRDQT